MGIYNGSLQQRESTMGVYNGNVHGVRTTDFGSGSRPLDGKNKMLKITIMDMILMKLVGMIQENKFFKLVVDIA